MQTDSEVAVTRFGSGGGFSNIYPVPYYYSKAVNGYLINLKPPYTSYSATYDQGIGAGAVSTTEMKKAILMSALWEIIL